jgi:hypothetical protein
MGQPERTTNEEVAMTSSLGSRPAFVIKEEEASDDWPGSRPTLTVGSFSAFQLCGHIPSYLILGTKS